MSDTDRLSPLQRLWNRRPKKTNNRIRTRGNDCSGNLPQHWRKTFLLGISMYPTMKLLLIYIQKLRAGTVLAKMFHQDPVTVYSIAADWAKFPTAVW